MAKASPKRIKFELGWPAFVIEADRDYLLARWIHFSGGGFHARAGFFAHQACEKYLKAIMVAATGEYLQTHRLPLLANECSDLHKMFSHTVFRTTITEFDGFDEVGRYGGAANHSPLKTKNPDFEIAAGFVWSGRHLDLLDQCVFNLRSLFNWNTVNFRDQIRAILENDLDAQLVVQWQGRPALKTVLLKQNRYFGTLPPLSATSAGT